MELSFPSELGYEVIARDAVAAFARRLGMPNERMDDLKTALCEACINAIEHGNSLEPGLRVLIACHLETDRIVIEVYDEGRRRFARHHEALSIIDKIAGLGPLRGMGLMLISELCDEAGFVDRSEGGNCFRIAFRQHAAPAPLRQTA